MGQSGPTTEINGMCVSVVVVKFKIGKAFSLHFKPPADACSSADVSASPHQDLRVMFRTYPRMIEQQNKLGRCRFPSTVLNIVC